MNIPNSIRTMFRGRVPLVELPRELIRRKRSAVRQKIERRDHEMIDKTPARLAPAFSSLSPADLRTQFRDRTVSFFPFPGDIDTERIKDLHLQRFPEETKRVIEAADRIVHESSWELSGLGSFTFNVENYWRCDPLTGKDWGREFHADVVVYEEDGADIRILWELNRFGHVVTLALAFVINNDEKYAEMFFTQIESWMRQNPYARGANWNCAMEVAVRAINLLAAFDIFRRSNACTENRLAGILKLFDQHGRFIHDNNEFSYITTSNHYLSDMAGLFWIGTLVPELKQSAEWKQFGLSEMLREMDKQILPDGADFEASTGYHKFVTELFLYSFLLAKRNGDAIPHKYWDKLRQMLEYIQEVTRPDGRVPLIGDADGSQIISMVKRDSDDQAYLLSLGAVIFTEPKFKQRSSPEILWLCGEGRVDAFESLQRTAASPAAVAFPESGSYVMRDGDLYLHFNANGCGINGRGSHGHNDALSIEISAFGRAFVVDPGSFVYNLDRSARDTFRSTAYHSTVVVDGEEQNSTDVDLPFVMGNEAAPVVIDWQTSPERDRISAEHFGYTRLKDPIVHRRTVDFNTTDKYWLIEDKLTGEGRHKFSFVFHLSPGLKITVLDTNVIDISDDDGRHLYVRAIGIDSKPEMGPAFVSRNYGHKENSSILRWEATTAAPCVARFLIVPASSVENSVSRLELMQRLADNIDN